LQTKWTFLHTDLKKFEIVGHRQIIFTRWPL
jgi:hypothetical protein